MAFLAAISLDLLFESGKREWGGDRSTSPSHTPGPYFFFFVAFLAAFFFAGIRKIPPFGPELDRYRLLKQHLG